MQLWCCTARKQTQLINWVVALHTMSVNTEQWTGKCAFSTLHSGRGKILIYFAYKSVYVGADENGKRIWPRNIDVLIPPSVHHLCDVETQHKWQRNEITVFVTIFDNAFEYSGWKNKMVRNDQQNWCKFLGFRWLTISVGHLILFGTWYLKSNTEVENKLNLATLACICFRAIWKDKKTI